MKFSISKVMSNVTGSLGTIFYDNIFPKLGDIGSGILDAIAFFFRTFIRPFWFSSSKSSIIAPYVYVFIGMIVFFMAVGLFLFLSYTAAIAGIKSPEIVLPTIAGVIATLVVTNNLMISVYNTGKSKDTKDETIQ